MRSILAIYLLLNFNLPNSLANQIEHKSCNIGVPIFNNWNLDSSKYSDFNYQLYQLKDILKEMYDIAVINAKKELLKKGYKVNLVNIPTQTLFSQSANETYKKEYKASSKKELYFSYQVNFNSKEEYKRNRPNKKQASAKSTVEIYLDKNLIAMKTKELRSHLFSSKKWQVLLEKALLRTIHGLPNCKKL